MTRAPHGDLPIGTKVLLIGDVEPLVIKRRAGERVAISVPGALLPHMTLRPEQEVEVVAVPSGYRHQWRPTR